MRNGREESRRSQETSGNEQGYGREERRRRVYEKNEEKLSSIIHIYRNL
jgi:hypothetical protein